MPTKAPARKKTVAKKKAPAKKAKVPKMKILGRVVHYYDQINVAIIECAAPIKLGDIVMIKRGDHELTQVISSMHIDHRPVAKAGKKDVIGLKVNSAVSEGSLVTPG